MPAAIRLVASWRAASTSGSRKVTPSHGRSASPSIPMVSRRTVRWASIRSIAALARRCASASATTRRSCSRSSSLSRARSIVPDAMSIASWCGSRSYSRSAIANGRAIPLPSARGSPASHLSTVAPASGRPAASSPLTPNKRRIARSWPTVVEARARAPQAPASASARATRRSSGQSDVMRRVVGTVSRARGPRSAARLDRGPRRSAAVWPGRTGA